MEWVETTGRSVEEAKEAALDELGVDEQDAEFEVVAEPRLGLFGRLRAEARVRARVRPTAPRAKDERRRKRSRAAASSDHEQPSNPTAEGAAEVAAEPVTETASPKPRTRAGTASRRPRVQSDTTPPPEPAAEPAAAVSVADVGPGAGAVEARPRRNRSRRPAETSHADVPAAAAGSQHPEEDGQVEVALEEQAKVAEAFLRGLADEMGLAAAVSVKQDGQESIELSLEGDDLGLLIGPKGSTLLALQDLTRTVVQRKTGASNGRLWVDVSGYRQKRAAALSRFAQQVAQEVLATGARKAMEPMNAADRKVVHDTINDIPGVATLSEGEDTNRRVIVYAVSD